MRAQFYRLIAIYCVLAVSGSALAEDFAVERPDPILHPIWVKGKTGFIDSRGRVVIEPRFDGARQFSEGLSQARGDGKAGYIDRTGKWVIEIDNHDDRPFRSGVAVVRNEKQIGIIDRSGRFTDCPFYWLENFSEGMSAVFKYEESRLPAGDPKRLFEWRHCKWGYVDTSGKLVIPLEYTAAGQFSDGLAPVYVGGVDRMCTGLDSGHWGYINAKGEMIIKPQFASAKPFSEGLACVSFDGRNFGWSDKTGKFAIKMRRLSTATSFQNGFARIRGESGSVPGWKDFGYITREGEVFVHPAFNADSSPFSDGLFRAREQPTWDGEKQAWIQGNYGFVDQRGKWVIEPSYTHTSPFHDGIAYVQQDGMVAYIDKAGETIWSAEIPSKSN